MIVTYLRSSSYGAHSMCPMRYFIEYNLGWRGPSGKKAEKGTIVHKVMEILGEVKITEQNGKKQFTDDIVGRVRINSYDLDKITEKVYDHYVGYSIHDYKDADLRECKNWINKALEYNDGKFDPRNNHIEAVEFPFDFEIMKPWAIYEYDDPNTGEKLEGFLSLKGTIDQINRVDEDTLEILDWKTGRRLDWATGEEKTLEKLQTDAQLRMYFYCVKKMFPEIKNVIVTIFFINDGGPFTLCFGEEDLEKTERMLAHKFETIKKSTNPQQVKSWKCKKFCHFGMTTFENTSQLPILNKWKEPMTKCEQVKYCLDHRGMEKVIANMSAEGHNIDHYQAPGAVSGDKKDG